MLYLVSPHHPFDYITATHDLNPFSHFLTKFRSKVQNLNKSPHPSIFSFSLFLTLCMMKILKPEPSLTLASPQPHLFHLPDLDLTHGGTDLSSHSESAHLIFFFYFFVFNILFMFVAL